MKQMIAEGPPESTLSVSILFITITWLMNLIPNANTINEYLSTVLLILQLLATALGAYAAWLTIRKQKKK